MKTLMVGGRSLEIQMHDSRLALWLMSYPTPTGYCATMLVKCGNKIGYGRWPIDPWLIAEMRQ